MFKSLLVFLFFYSFVGLSLAENFHLSKDNCNNCHLDLNNPKALKDGPNRVCESCHPDVHPSHKVGVKTRLNRENLPLDEEGKITCAYTCHNVHPKGNKDFEKRLLRMDINKICFSCHNK